MTLAGTSCADMYAAVSGFYPYIWWVQLAPSEKWGGEF